MNDAKKLSKIYYGFTFAFLTLYAAFALFLTNANINFISSDFIIIGALASIPVIGSFGLGEHYSSVAKTEACDNNATTNNNYQLSKEKQNENVNITKSQVIRDECLDFLISDVEEKPDLRLVPSKEEPVEIDECLEFLINDVSDIKVKKLTR